MRTIPLKKMGLVFACVLLTLVLLTGIMVSLIPTIVSSERVRKMIEEKAKAALGTDVHIGEIHWSFREGILLKEIRVKDHPEFSDKEILILEKAHLQIFPWDLFKKRVHAELLISGLSIHIIKNESGLLNLNRLFSGRREGPEEVPKEAPLPDEKGRSLPSIALLFDVTLNLTLNEVNASYADLGTKKTASIDHLNGRLDIPSLIDKPSRLLLLSDLSINGAPFPGQKLGLIIHPHRLSGREVDVKEMAVDLEGSFPGITLTGKGNPLKEGFKGALKIDFPTIRTLLAPFLLENLKMLDLKGALSFEYDIKTSPAFETLSFDTALYLKKTLIEGGPVPGGPLGPLSLSLKNKGEYRLKERNLSIPSGELAFLSDSRISYRLEILDVPDSGPRIDVKIAPLHLNIKELYDFLTPVLPDNLKTNPPVAFDALVLDIDAIALQGKVTDIPEIQIDQLRLSSPALQGNSKSAPFVVKDLLFSIPEGEMTGIKRSSTSPIGVTGEIHVKPMLSAGEIDIPKTVLLTSLSQSADLLFQISETFPVHLAVNELKAAIGHLKLNLPEPDTLNTGVTLAMTAPDMTINGFSPFSMDISKADLNLALDDALTLKAQASISDLAKTRIETQGSVSVDLSRMTGKIAPALRKGATLSGAASLEWNLAGRIFTASELEKLREEPHAIEENLPFIDKASLSVGLFDAGVDMRLPENKRLRVRALSTQSPLSYTYDGKSGLGKLRGNIHLKEILPIPGDPFTSPVSLALEIQGENQGAKSISLSQSLVVTPLNIRETLNLNLMGTDALLASGIHTPLSDILTHLDGAFSLSIVPNGKEAFSVVKAIPALEGEVSIGIEGRLIPKKRATLNLFANMHDVTARDPGLFTVQNMDAALRFDKTWEILYEKKDPVTLKHHLSAEVLNPGLDTRSFNRAASEKMAGFLNTMKTGLNPARTLSISRFQLEKGFPLTASDIALDLAFNHGLPMIPYFKIDALGGTLITAASVLRKADLSILAVTIAFSGIDTRRVFSEKTGGKENPDTEISGKAAFTLPLSPDMTRLTSGLKMDLYFSHIGKKALEKMLYSLDPTESNEQIVAQRKLLRKGTPRWIRLLVEDGALSLSGKVLVFNMEEDIPPIQRLNISNLSILKAHEKSLEGMGSVADILTILSASHIDITRKEGVTFSHQTQ